MVSSARAQGGVLPNIQESCKAVYVVSHVHLAIFTPRLDRVDRRVYIKKNRIESSSSSQHSSTAAGARTYRPMHGHTDTRTCVYLFVCLAENWALPTPTRFPDSRVQIRSPPLGAIGIFFIKILGIVVEYKIYKIY